MSDLTGVQIASLISDTRVESSYQEYNAAGSITTTRLVEFPTVDDLMVSGMKAVAAEIKFSNLTYSSVQSRDMVTQIVRTQIPLVRS
jgi:hypothetical protein